MKLLLLFAALLGTLHAGDLNDPATELASFRLAEGFEANLFASEANGVVKPIQIRWDARGRLWVICSRTYPQIKPGEEPDDQVLILEDTDHDGRADRTTVFAGGFLIPTGLEVDADGRGAWVGEGSKLWHLRDDDGDGKADRRDVVLRGFGTGDNHQNINSFAWSPGGELMFCQGLHAYSRVETPWGIAKLDGAGLWRYRPREQRLDSFYGGAADPQNPWGWVFTDWGQPLVVAGNNGGIYHPLPEMIRGHDQTRAGNLWVDARGRKCSGPDIVGTAHLPLEWQGVLLSGGYINNAVWALDIADDGSSFKIKDRPPLLTSTHTSFRPVDVKMGPDGAIYVCDWYNPIIGHYQASFRHPDRDRTHGRIWRVRYKDRGLMRPPLLADLTTEQLIPHLASSERWVRYQTRRLLAGRPREEVVKHLDLWLATVDNNVDLPWFEALCVFESHDHPSLSAVMRVVASPNADMRAYAIGVAGRWGSTEPIFESWGTLAAIDQAARVRLAGIVAAGNILKQASLEVVFSAAERPRDKFINSALTQAKIALKPIWEPQLASAAKLKWKPEWVNFLTNSDTGPSVVKQGPKATAKTLELMREATAGHEIGKLRASPEMVKLIALEVGHRGDVKRGEAIYRRAELACVACHAIGGQGGNIGPVLDTIGSGQPLDFIIGAVLEPQREVKEGYEALEITTKDGQIQQGYLVREEGGILVLRDVALNGEKTIALDQISSRRQVGSVMPSGLLDKIPREELPHLFKYLASLGKPQ